MARIRSAAAPTRGMGARKGLEEVMSYASLLQTAMLSTGRRDRREAAEHVDHALIELRLARECLEDER